MWRGAYSTPTSNSSVELVVSQFGKFSKIVVYPIKVSLRNSNGIGVAYEENWHQGDINNLPMFSLLIVGSSVR